MKCKKNLIRDYEINIIEGNDALRTPLIINNTFDDNAKEIYDECVKMGTEDFTLVNIRNLSQMDNLSPWNVEGEKFLGGADEYIKVLTDEIIPKTLEILSRGPSQYIICGYSLAGLFALYSLYKTDLFDKAICCSGSLWYPKFIDFMNQNEMLREPDSIYFSLGKKEMKSRHYIYGQVGNNTQEIFNYVKDKGISSIYEQNEGNHFTEVNKRISRGIKWSIFGEK